MVADALPTLINREGDVQKEELTDTGFEHISGKRDRAININRVQSAKQIGDKLPPPYPNGWFAVVESRDLKVGKMVSVDALGLNLCVYRGEDNVARCVEAYCPHLGANLAIGGTVSGSCITCPFHQWKFNADGQCVGIPNVETVPAGISIKKYHTMELDGAVWVWHDAEGRDPLWKVPEAPEMKYMTFRGRNEFMVNVHIQIGPSHVRLHFECLLGSLMVAQSVTPLSPLLQRVVTRVFTPNYNAVFGAFMVLAEAMQFKRDVTIWNNKRYVSVPPYVRSDKTIRAYRAWFMQFYSENSVSLKQAMQKPLDW
ncbi:3-ketosteroid-9-alpha-hydroxylase oxygenase subunit [Papilio machaon]|uniref:cholesterol 7-desaturase n=1 Tax=Papilio machaon TaxID=76193 RepID=A0A0N0PDJ2_PAPMA|nr:3-ketosteroid-9-alpha-hydroxylase oxygenase subunit [Papilio machaon]